MKIHIHTEQVSVNLLDVLDYVETLCIIIILALPTALVLSIIWDIGRSVIANHAPRNIGAEKARQLLDLAAKDLKEQSENTTTSDIPEQYRHYAQHWRQGFSDGATLISLCEPVVREEIADYSRDEFNAYYDGVSTRITKDRERAVRRDARAQELQRLKALDTEYHHALKNDI